MNNQNNNNKKLLILGGTRISLQILKAAKELGMIVYVADYNEDSACKAIADKSFMISATDIDGITTLIKEENINGVIMGYADVLLESYVKICDKANLPCYANLRAIEITTDKYKFKEYCRKYEIPVVEEYSYTDVIDRKAHFPVIVKPVDNSGARGIFICHNMGEFKEYFEEAKKYSKSGRVLIEKMMSGKEATIFYYLHDGEIYLLGVGDRWMYEQNDQLLKLPIGYTFPSKNTLDFIKFENDKIKRMFKSLDMKEGMVFIQTFIEDNKYIVYEMGYRLTGSIEHHLFEKQYGFNHLKAILEYAVGNDVSKYVESVKIIDPLECCMANVSLILKKGKIESIKGIDTIKSMPGVIDFHISHLPGENIDDKIIGKLAQLGIRVLIKADNESMLLTTMDEVKDAVIFESSAGKDMIIKDYKYQNICE